MRRKKKPKKRREKLSELRTKAMLERIDELMRDLTPLLTQLRPQQRRGMLRMPADSAPVRTSVMNLARAKGLVKADIGEAPSEIATAFAARLARLSRVLDLLGRAVNDTRRVSEAQAWSEVTALYSMLVSMARFDADVAVRLRHARAYFKKRRKGKRPAKPRAAKDATKK
jgi:hypothetical protein